MFFHLLRQLLPELFVFYLFSMWSAPLFPFPFVHISFVYGSDQELIRSVKRCETLPVYYKEGGYYLWDMKNPIDAPFHIYEQEQMVCAG